LAAGQEAGDDHREQGARAQDDGGAAQEVGLAFAFVGQVSIL